MGMTAFWMMEQERLKKEAKPVVTETDSNAAPASVEPAKAPKARRSRKDKG